MVGRLLIIVGLELPMILLKYVGLAATPAPKSKGHKKAMAKRRLGRWTLEDQEQAAFVEWFRLKHPRSILLSIPNGDERPYVVRERLLTTGMLPGAPDLMLAERVQGLGGMFIEMKSKNPKTGKKYYPTKRQRELHQRLREKGYAVVVCWSADEAMEAAERYLHGLQSS